MVNSKLTIQNHSSATPNSIQA